MFSRQTVSAYLHCARRGVLRNLTEVAKNADKDALRGLKVIQGHQTWYRLKGHVVVNSSFGRTSHGHGATVTYCSKSIWNLPFSHSRPSLRTIPCEYVDQPCILTLSPPIPFRLYTLPYWSNPPYIIFDIRTLWRSVLSPRAPECQKLKMVS